MCALRHCNALVVDMTHGGQVLCKELLRRSCTVHCFDNHRTLSEASLRELRSMGVEVHRDEAEVPDVDVFDVVVVQHADPKLGIFSEALKAGVPIITHARAAGIILGSEKGSTRIVEVTGTNGKTTVCKMMAKVALDQGLKLLVHDSTGTMLGDDECEVLAEGLSITPANTLRAWRLAEERGFKPDLCIFEVSLGGTGAADVGVVTGIYNNYDVSFMVNAFNSKLQMALNMGDRGILVLNGDNKPSRRFAHAFRGLCNVFGFEGGLQVKGRLLSYDLNEGMLIGGEIQGLNALGSSKVDGPFNLKLGAQLFGRHQALNALAALTAMLSLNLKVDEVCSSLSEFEGVEGRSKASFEDWGLMIDCRNRGIAIPVVASVLGEAIGLKRLNLIKKLIVVIGGSGRVACEIADVNRLSAELKRLSEVDLCVLYGALSFRLSGLGVKCQVFNSLEESISYARSEASKSPRSMVVICSDET